ncbi:hypothetical protein [Embleya sp. NPDC050493]|uniref:terpene synthase family protein n=1 Tax=Embleya sp. NPDC050493 TaxID=3363989 RepID=UPI0037978175
MDSDTKERNHRLELLPLYCPIPEAVHPDADAIEQHCVEWLDRFKLYFDDAQRSRLIGTKAALIYSMALPEADAQRVADVSKWLYWGFATDDMFYDNGPTSVNAADFLKMAARLVRLCEEPRASFASELPFSDALRDLVRSITGSATPLQLLEWSQTARAWFFGMAWDVGNAERGKPPGLNDYLMMRMHTGGLASWVTSLNIAQGIELAPRESAAGHVRALMESWSTFALIINDLTSYAKEARNGDTSSNIVTVIAHERGCTPQDALREAYLICDRISALFTALAQRVHKHGSPALSTCVRNLEHTWRGIIEWGFQAARYNVDPHTGEVFQEFPGWAPHPTTQDRAPLPYPAISWWWDELDDGSGR